MKDDVTRPGYNQGIATENQFVIGYTISQSAGDAGDFRNLFERTTENLGFVPGACNSDGAYGSEENMQYLEDRNVDCFLKYRLYQKEKSPAWNHKRMRRSAFVYDGVQDCFICPNREKLRFKSSRTVKARSGYPAHIRVYRASPGVCSQCPLRAYCTDAPARQLNINENYERLTQQTRENLNSTRGKRLRRMRGHAVETAFGAEKRNAGRRRFYVRGLAGAEVESGLFWMARNLQRIRRFLIELPRRQILALP